MSSLSSVGIEELHWCSGSTAHLQASDVVLNPAWRRTPSLIRSFQENLFSGRFDFIDFTTVQIWVDKHRWWSGSIVAFQAFGMGSFLVRGRTYNVDRNFPEILATQEIRSLLFSSVHIEIEEHRCGSGSLAALEAIDVCSIPVRCRSYNIDGIFAVIFVTKEYPTLMFSFSSVGIEEHHWCSGSTAHLQAIDMGLIPAWRRRQSLIRIFQENLASEVFKSKIFSTDEIWLDKHLLCSGWIVSFQSIENGSIPVRCKKFRLSKLFSSLFDADEL